MVEFLATLFGLTIVGLFVRFAIKNHKKIKAEREAKRTGGGFDGSGSDDSLDPKLGLK